ncbi:zinc-dependent alcohol dehydrogenase family protein [Oceanobacillus sp. ISL-73]|uniref:zinc-dependent alcohol dehydrogenase family protein n=1 Tax=Oceanobacillus sp. ISL-73 TaxID=2819161 RepID=UPI001BEA91A0|nr:zinc-dependent alcohol dehydrogenase family protein [Oceanobacillus sp. ISL-73]MBT2653212.1 zinc-dependent alcohol dehydrogenase family protein [Oceanobacillus sp. ISL-73]
MKAKCIQFTDFGSPNEVLNVEYKVIQPPKENEILVRMIGRPINPSDLIPIRGAYAHRIPLPSIPGYEGVGIVEDIGSAVSPSLVGKRVLPLRGEGTWQEFVKTSADYTVVIPDSIDHFTAAQMYINPITAWVICTQELGLSPNDVLLVNACGSSIGHLFAQLSKVLDFRLIAITRNDNYSKELERLGASYVINTSVDSLYEAVMDLTDGVGANAAIDSIGGTDGNHLAFCVRPEGTFLTLGLLSGVQVDWANIINNAKVNAKLFHLRHWNKRSSIDVWQETFNQLIALIQDKKLRLMRPGSFYSLTEIWDAVHNVETMGANQGKVFLMN